MAFFEDPKVNELAQRHIKDISKLEESESKALLRRYRDIRRELADRLALTPGDTFTAQRLRGVLVQVDAAISQMGSSLKAGMAESGQKASIRGSDHLIREIQKFDKEFTGAATPIDLDKFRISNDTTSLLANQYDVSIDAYSQQVRADISRGLTNAAIEQTSFYETTQRLNKFFLGEEWKLLRIARTELHNIYSLSKQNGLQDIKEQFLPDLKKTLFHPMDERTGADSKQAAQANLIVAVDKPFRYVFTRVRADGSVVSEERVFMVPPDRPNDRSIMIPYRDSWD